MKNKDYQARQMPKWERDLRMAAFPDRSRQARVTKEVSHEYGYELTLVNGHPISFTKLTETRPFGKPKRTSRRDEDSDGFEDY